MIDPIGVKPGTVQDRPVALSRETKVTSIDPVRPVGGARAAETEMRATARAMAVRPPVDAERVEQIKRALQEGRFPIVPALIADRLIAAEMLWADRNDQN
jgi:negative regulator of flagellin synthesis FlgM